LPALRRQAGGYQARLIEIDTTATQGPAKSRAFFFVNMPVRNNYG
jgi:hypothetical protein